MLWQRVITAIVLLALLIPALLAPTPLAFSLLTLVLIAAAGWEWARLNGARGVPALVMGALVCVACALMLWLPPSPSTLAGVWWVAALAWGGIGALALNRGPAGWPGLPGALRLPLGLLVLWVAWLAISQARHAGINFVLSVFCLVWVADIAAYAGGRTFGRHKLAPSISPGKTWEGAASGALGVLLLALGWRYFDSRVVTDSPSLYTLIDGRLGLLGLLVAALVLAGMSVVGDLVESLVKRSAGAKDSSRLLPGHGGVLDRVDALLPVFPIAMALATL